MTIEELKKSGSIIFESISGSRAYGLDTATSDTDIRGVFILPIEQYYSLNYIAQVNNETNDIAYYELSKFVELLSKNNPNIMELLNVPKECILYKHPIFDTIKKEDFLSKLCKNTFANYAFTQIKKARGLNKKIVNPVEKKRKSIEDFCYVRDEKQSILFKDYISSNCLSPKHCGLVKLSHMKDCYNLFYDENLNYNGIARTNANVVCLSSVPKSEKPIALLYFNIDGYSTYCNKYKEYWDWVDKRNDARYKSNISHSKNYDAKNMMHTFRLLHMAKEIGLNNAINVRRKDRDYLLSIKNAEFEYDDLVSRAETMKEQLNSIYNNSQLMEKPDLDSINKIVYEIRNNFYTNVKPK
ncbi:nucleotidyltransferase domain-containing protein [Winogradskyella helgolandensis]|uniref:nucleotidyltransferase domain-containing protein n=1 Tax=Winogradskyella helgolandensis TaxID=2697010 RepID=UPI0015B86FA1|nr:nucleotidyltransferase domain-containing protein [Winogradskyella helgolandensis]